MPSVKIVEKGNISGILEMFNNNKDKRVNSGHLLKWKKSKNGRRLDKCDAIAGILFFRERESTFSLDFQPIGPSVFDIARRKVTLRDEDYAWTPIGWSSDNSKR